VVIYLKAYQFVLIFFYEVINFNENDMKVVLFLEIVHISNSKSILFIF